MTKLWRAALLAAFPVAGLAQAQEFRGAEISGEVLAYTDDSELGETTYRGSLEFGVLGGFGVQADLAFHDARTIDFGSRAFTLHASYDAFGVGTIGAFYARDTVEGSGAAPERDVALYGLEGAKALGGAAVEGYAGIFSGDGMEGQAFGLEGGYDLTGAITLTGSAAFVSGDVEASRLSIGGQYRFGQGPAVFAEVGRLDGSAEEDAAAFVTLGARLAIGPNDGTTFGGRGLYEVLSGL